MNSRRPPLFTCGYSFVTISNEVYRKAEHFNGPFGLTKKITKLASKSSPFISALQCQLLVILLYVDQCILAIECKAEAMFPPSKNLFNKVDEFILIAETFPAKLDDGFDRFPSLIHQVPFLEWALVCAISWLNFLVSKLTDWRSGSKEREISVDINCNNNAIESENHVRRTDSDNLPVETETGVCPNGARCSYKDALLEKTKEKTERNGEGSCLGGGDCNGKIEKKREGVSKHDLVLKLLESAWP